MISPSPAMHRSYAQSLRWMLCVLLSLALLGAFLWALHLGLTLHT